LHNKRTVALVILVVVLGVGGGGFFLARIFLIRTFRVPSGSMKNTIIPGDHILAVKMFGQPERGNLIVFQYPRGSSKWNREDTDYYIGRIVGLPGETIQLRDHTVYINDRPLDEIKVLATEGDVLDPLTVISTEGKGPYRVFYLEITYEPGNEPTLGTTTPFRIPADNFFVLADNRDNSLDSRYRGPVPRKLIWGSLSLIYLSVSDSGKVRTERMLKRVE
jgi:signal peptidase I